MTKDIKEAHSARVDHKAYRIIAVDGTSADFECTLVDDLQPIPQVSIHLPQQRQREFFSLISEHQNSQVWPCCVRFESGIDINVFALYELNSRDTFKLIPTKQPFDAACPHLEKSVLQKVCFKVVNGPNIQGQQSEFRKFPDGSGRWVRRQEVEFSPWTMLLEEEAVLDTSSTFYRITHQGYLSRIDGQAFSVKDADHLLVLFRLALSFVGGASCSIVCVQGQDLDGKLVWEQWGGRGAAPQAQHLHYSAIHKEHILPNSVQEGGGGPILALLMPQLWQFHQNPQQAHWSLLENALLWYLKSNEIKETVVSIILSQTAWESLSHFVLEGNFGAVRRCGPRTAANNLRSVLDWLQIDPKDYQGCHKLEQIGKQCNKEDVPHLLTDIRSDLIHKEARMNVSALVHWEASEISQWYVEMMLLKVSGYQTQYLNRITKDMSSVSWGTTVASTNT